MLCSKSRTISCVNSYELILPSNSLTVRAMLPDRVQDVPLLEPDLIHPVRAHRPVGRPRLEHLNDREHTNLVRELSI